VRLRSSHAALGEVRSDAAKKGVEERGLLTLGSEA
jgi:hypothetical protein